MKTNDALEKIFKDGDLSISVFKDNVLIIASIDPKLLTKNLNNIAIDLHYLIDSCDKVKAGGFKDEINLNKRDTNTLLKYIEDLK